jgi:hypothetical protein
LLLKICGRVFDVLDGEGRTELKDAPALGGKIRGLATQDLESLVPFVQNLQVQDMKGAGPDGTQGVDMLRNQGLPNTRLTDNDQPGRPGREFWKTANNTAKFRRVPNNFGGHGECDRLSGES